MALGSSSHTKSITENSESENKDKPIGERKKARRMKGRVLNLNVKINVK